MTPATRIASLFLITCDAALLVARLRDDASGQTIHVLGVEHPTPPTQRTDDTVLVVDRADADYVQVGRLWSAA